MNMHRAEPVFSASVENPRGTSPVLESWRAIEARKRPATAVGSSDAEIIFRNIEYFNRLLEGSLEQPKRAVIERLLEEHQALLRRLAADTP